MKKLNRMDLPYENDGYVRILLIVLPEGKGRIFHVCGQWGRQTFFLGGKGIIFTQLSMDILDILCYTKIKKHLSSISRQCSDWWMHRGMGVSICFSKTF